MRARLLLLLAAALAAWPAARAQLGPSGSLGTGASPVQLAQFQPGIGPRANNLDLGPGQSVRLALNCVDLFADTPTARVVFVAPPSDATVTLVSSMELALSDAIGAGLIQVREVLADVDGIAFVEFGNEDVVRHKLVQRIVEAYRRHAEETGTARRR